GEGVAPEPAPAAWMWRRGGGAASSRAPAWSLGRRGVRRRLRLRPGPLDALELLLRALADRPLEPVPGRQQIPPAEQHERAADGDRRVVDDVPVEALLPRDARRGDRHQEQHADQPDPQDRQRIDPLVVIPEMPRAPLEALLLTPAQDDREHERD